MRIPLLMEHDFVNSVQQIASILFIMLSENFGNGPTFGQCKYLAVVNQRSKTRKISIIVGLCNEILLKLEIVRDLAAQV